jgi:hypothetical protein
MHIISMFLCSYLNRRYYEFFLPVRPTAELNLGSHYKSIRYEIINVQRKDTRINTVNDLFVFY